MSVALLLVLKHQLGLLLAVNPGVYVTHSFPRSFFVFQSWWKMCECYTTTQRKEL